MKRSEKTVRKWIIGGCRKCGTEAENHARGLCGSCEWAERTRGTIGDWPKIGPESLAATRDGAARLAEERGIPLRSTKVDWAAVAAVAELPGVALEFAPSRHERVRAAVELVLDVCEQRAARGQRLSPAQMAGFIAASLPSLVEG